MKAEEENNNGSLGVDALQGVFGPDVELVCVKEGIMSRLGMILAAVPLSLASAEVGRPLNENCVAGVICGGKTKLVVMAFSSSNDAEAFVVQNPVLTGTLLTRLQTKTLVWFKSLRGLPPTSSWEDGVQVISQGVVPVYAPANMPVDCLLVSGGPPREIVPDELKITGGGRLEQILEDWLARELFGPPFVGTKRKLNAKYWARLLMKLGRLRFDELSGSFVRSSSDTPSDVVLENGLVPELIAAFIQRRRRGTRWCQTKPRS